MCFCFRFRFHCCFFQFRTKPIQDPPTSFDGRAFRRSSTVAKPIGQGHRGFVPRPTAKTPHRRPQNSIRHVSPFRIQRCCCCCCCCCCLRALGASRDSDCFGGDCSRRVLPPSPLGVVAGSDGLLPEIAEAIHASDRLEATTGVVAVAVAVVVVVVADAEERCVPGRAGRQHCRFRKCLSPTNGREGTVLRDRAQGFPPVVAQQLLLLLLLLLPLLVVWQRDLRNVPSGKEPREQSLHASRPQNDRDDGCC